MLIFHFNDQLGGIEHSVHVPRSLTSSIDIIVSNWICAEAQINLEFMQFYVVGVACCNILCVQSFDQVLNLEVMLFVENVVD